MTQDKINIAELLKDCPQGMELDCILFNNPVTLDEVADIDEYSCPIMVTTVDGDIETFTKYGQYLNREDAKCIIFPKGKTTWEGFIPPCKFKDGDIVFTTLGNIAIIRKPIGGELFSVYGIMVGNCFYKDETVKGVVERHATEEEKQKLFDAIKANGYKWNEETKTLEKLPKFKVGDEIRIKGTFSIYVVTEIREDCYMLDDKGISLLFKNQDEWELVLNKFDITTLKPFESRVLVRNSCDGFWMPTFWGIYEAEKANRHLYRNYLTTKGFFLHCIPYNDDTKHLLGTTDDCDDFYKTWE